MKNQNIIYFHLWIAVLTAILGSATTSHALSAALPPMAPPAKAALCTACHGMDGISANELFPNLKGQKEAYLRTQILAFRSGLRKDPTTVMNSLSSSLTDQEIEELAKFFSTIP